MLLRPSTGLLREPQKFLHVAKLLERQMSKDSILQRSEQELLQMSVALKEEIKARFQLFLQMIGFPGKVDSLGMVGGYPGNTQRSVA